MQVSPTEPAATGLGQLATAALRAAVEAVVPTAGAVAPVADTVLPVSLAVVDVLAAEPDGRVRVSIDARTEVATSAEPLQPGGRYVLQVERTAAGVVLSPPAESPELPAAVAAAVLRASAPPDLGPTLHTVLGELAAVPPGSMGDAAATVREAVRGFLPDGRPPDAAQLRNWVENGGLHFEAKLGRQAAPPTQPTTSAESPAAPPPPLWGRSASAASRVGGDVLRDPPPAVPLRGTPTSPTPPVTGHPKADPAGAGPREVKTADAPAPSPPARQELPDLKGALLRLLHAARDLGEAAPLAAARAAVDGIEANQAANVLAREGGTPYILQVPFPDRDVWKTLHLAVEPEGRSDDPAARPDGFRLLLHVPLSDLGETWVDAGLAGDRFRAVLYLDAAPARDRVRAELPGLRADLSADGFGEVLLDVRAAADLPARRKQLSGAMAAGRPADGSVLDVRA